MKILMGLLLGALVAGPSIAETSTVDISSAYNSRSGTLTNGYNYPAAGTTATIGGVDFAIGSFNGSSDAGMVTNSWAGNPASVTIDIADLADVSTLYTIINSAGGGSGNVGGVTLNFDGGSSWTYDLIEGSNLRDHYNGGYNNSAPDVFATATYDGNLRWDVQRIDVPLAYQGLTLTSLTLFNTNPGGGNPLLFAVSATTGSAVPEPAGWAMMIAGFGMAGAALRRSKRLTVRFA